MRQQWRTRAGEHGARKDELERQGPRQELLEVQLGAFEQDLAKLAAALREAVPELADASDQELYHQVLVVQGGARFKSVEAIDARIRDCQRLAAFAARDLGSDGSGGVQHIHFAARFGFSYDSPANRLRDRRDQPADGVLADLERTIVEQSAVMSEKNREMMETLVMSSLARDLQAQVERLESMMVDINRLLRGAKFGRSEYQFRAAPSPDRRGLVDVVRRLSVLDADSRAEFRAWIDDHMDELRSADDGEVPEILDYRSWFDVSLRMRSEGADGVELTRSVRALGYGGEQGVPNYLLVLALGSLMFEGAGAKLRPLMFDEAFYGIDAGRRDQLLRFATDLGMQLLIASPDQDGVTPSVRAATTLFIVKDGAGDVHLAPYHYWHDPASSQRALFEADGPRGPTPEQAECRLQTATTADLEQTRPPQ